MLLLKDAKSHPELFRWNGAVAKREFDRWLRGIGRAPNELVQVWKQTGGGEMFAAESLCGPQGSGGHTPSLAAMNGELRVRGLPRSHVVFHNGLCLTAFRVADMAIVTLDGKTLKEKTDYPTLSDWYRDEIRNAYAERYGLAVLG